MWENTRAHSRAITALAITPKGDKVISGSRDDSIKCWEGEATGVHVWEKKWEHSGAVNALVITPLLGKFVISGGGVVIKCWEVNGGGHMWTLNPDSGRVKSLAIKTNGLAAADVIAGFNSNPGGVQCWTFNSVRPIQKWKMEGKGRPDYVDALAVAARRYDRYVISAPPAHHAEAIVTCRKVVRNFASELWKTKSEQGLVCALAVTPDNNHVISGGLDGSVKCWLVEAVEGSEKNPVWERKRAHTNYVNALAITPNGQHVISSGEDNSITCWKIPKVLSCCSKG